MLVIIPVRNEEKTIAQTVAGLHLACKGDLLFIDDGSTDQTVEILNKLKTERMRVINNMFDRGKGSAIKTACVLSNMIYALKPEDDIIFIDGDGQIDPKEIPMYLDLMKLYRADVAIGNKRHSFSVTHYPPLRRIVSSTYNLMIRALFGIHYQDTQCGIKIFKKYALDKVIQKVTIKRYAFDIELIIALKDLGYRIIDAPVKIAPQVNKGSVSIGNIIRTFFDTMIVWVKRQRGFYIDKKR